MSSSKNDLKMDQMGAKPVRGGQDVCFSVVNGVEFLKNPKYCKGLAFSIEERQVLGKFRIYMDFMHFHDFCGSS